MSNIPIIFFKKMNSVGGPTSFQRKFTSWLNQREITYDFLNIKNLFRKKILIINSGTFNFPLLILSILFNTKIIQRLDGFYDYSNVGRKTKTLKCFLTNLSIQFIRKYLANYLIYQSLSSKKLWDKTFNKVNTKYSIIHNPSFGNSKNFKKTSKVNKSYDIIIVEGNIENNYYYYELFNLIDIATKNNFKIKNIYIFGKIDFHLKNKFRKNKKFIFKNVVNQNVLKSFYKRNNVIFFGIEYIPCCSNSIIEANSYGLPSITFNTGSYKELIQNSGIQINYKDIFSKNLDLKISNALTNIIKNYEKFSKRSLVNSNRFHPDYIFAKYLKCVKQLF